MVNNIGYTMEIIKNIHKRRSIRQFNNNKISENDINTILSAGMTAPSAMNKQPWRFILITDEKIKQEVVKISKYAQMMLQSPFSVLVCGDTDASYLDYWKIDCSACIQNMLLASCALNIGSVWTGISGDEMINDYKKLFNLPENIIPHSLIVFGYSNVPFEERNYFDITKVHNNKW